MVRGDRVGTNVYMFVHRLLFGLPVDRDYDALERRCLPGPGKN